MQARNYYAHIDPDGRQGYDLAHTALPECDYTAENLAASRSASDAVNAWLNSPEHRTNMLDSKYNYTGFGVALHGDYYYIVEHFCDIPPQPTYSGATGLCRDNTPTYAQNHQGACSWHGGVAEWY